jgi:uncharacterized protein DUF4160
MSPSDAMLSRGAGRRRPERRALPEISRFFGIVVYLNQNDHSPPHFHARYQGRGVSVEIRTLRVIGAGLPARALGLLVEWASIHQTELLQAWDDVRSGRRPARIAPLD